MDGLGLVEGFFGPEWSQKSRIDFIGKLSSMGGSYYIYAPKRDSYLRKNWREPFPEDLLESIGELARTCKENQVQFGVGLSPFGLGKKMTSWDRDALTVKLNQLNEVGINILGLFFDDMESHEDLASSQIEVASFIADTVGEGCDILFCPSFYSYDPILEKVFGNRPENYWPTLKENLDPRYKVMWTGPKVISETISEEDIKIATETLGRAPFLWDNYYANDGPKNCQFIKLCPFRGREKKAYQGASGWALNLMNQPYLSQIAFEAASNVLQKDQEPNKAYTNALSSHLTPEESDFVETHFNQYYNVGLEKSGDEAFKSSFQFKSLYAKDFQDWTHGKYIVGSECLTD